MEKTKLTNLLDIFDEAIQKCDELSVVAEKYDATNNEEKNKEIATSLDNIKQLTDDTEIHVTNLTKSILS